MATGSPTYLTRPTAIGQHSTGALTPTTRLDVSDLTSSPSRITTTPGARLAAVTSMETISACACGERRIAAWSVPGRTPRSSMKRPRPDSSAVSSTRAIDCPTHRASGSSLAGKWLAASAIPKSSRAFLSRQETIFIRSASSGHTAPSQNLPFRLILSLCSAASTREPGDVAKLAGADTGVILEEAREMPGLGEAELLADVAEAVGLIEHRIDRLFHAHDVEVDLWRHAD